MIRRKRHGDLAAFLVQLGRWPAHDELPRRPVHHVLDEIAVEHAAVDAALHRVVRFRHALEARGEKLDRGPIGRPGDNETVCVTAARPPSFEQIHGASFREVIDLADWDHSLAINVPGQSGDPASAHYDDLIRLWTNGDSFPLLFTKPQVEQNASETITVHPTAGKKGK